MPFRAGQHVAARSSGHQVRGRPSPGVASRAARAQLPRLARAVGRAIQELARELVPTQPPVADELAQGVLGADMQQVVQLLAEMSGLRLVDERLGRGDQGADAGEPDPVGSPRWSIDPFVTAAMRVAGASRQALELSKRGAPGACAQRRHPRTARRRLLAQQRSGEFGWSHYGTIMVPGRNSATNAGRTPPRIPRNSCSGQRLARQEIRPTGPLYSAITDICMKLFLRRPLVRAQLRCSIRKPVGNVSQNTAGGQEF